MIHRSALFALLFLALSIGISSFADAREPHRGGRKMQLSRTSRSVYDVRVADTDRLLFNLRLVKETWEGMKGKGMDPRFVVTIRGGAVRSFTREEMTAELAELLADLRSRGIRVEICRVALRVSGVEEQLVVPDVEKADNVLISQILLQNRGYALIVLA